MNIAGFDHLVSFTFVLTNASVIPATDQAAATKDLFGVGVVVRVADGGGQTSHLDVAEPPKFGPNLIGGLSE